MNMEKSNEELRYLEHFGLRFNPFPVAPDVDNFFLSNHIDRLITEIVHGILTRKGFMVLTGEIGLGKTTISRKIINILDRKGVETSLIFHTAFQDVELLKEINRDFGLDAEGLILGDQMRLLNNFLLDRNRAGKNCAIIIDDAQNLKHKSLELVRMISNLETHQQKLVQILLIGQPELVDKLNASELRQLKSRIVIHEEARPLSIEELKNYLLFKLNAAGNHGKTTIKGSALKKIHQLTKGNFRQVNMLMDRCLYVAFLHNTAELGKAVVKEAHIDFSLAGSGALKRPLILGLSGLAFFCIIGVAIYSLSYLEFPTQDFARSFLGRPAMDTGQKHMGRHQDFVAVYRAKIPVDIPGPIVEFLKGYGLSKYDDSFFAALKTNRFQNLSDTIFEQTGYRLIQLEYVPEDIRKIYGILAYPLVTGSKEVFFLFWRPRDSSSGEDAFIWLLLQRPN